MSTFPIQECHRVRLRGTDALSPSSGVAPPRTCIETRNWLLSPRSVAQPHPSVDQLRGCARCRSRDQQCRRCCSANTQSMIGSSRAALHAPYWPEPTVAGATAPGPKCRLFAKAVALGQRSGSKRKASVNGVPTVPFGELGCSLRQCWSAYRQKTMSGVEGARSEPASLCSVAAQRAPCSCSKVVEHTCLPASVAAEPEPKLDPRKVEFQASS